MQRNGSVVSVISYSSFAVVVDNVSLWVLFVLDRVDFNCGSKWVKNDSLNVKQANADLDEFTVRNVS